MVTGSRSGDQGLKTYHKRGSDQSSNEMICLSQVLLPLPVFWWLTSRDADAESADQTTETNEKIENELFSNEETFLGYC